MCEEPVKDVRSSMKQFPDVAEAAKLHTAPLPLLTVSRPTRPPAEAAVFGRLNETAFVQLPSDVNVNSIWTCVTLPHVLNVAELGVIAAVPQLKDGVNALAAVFGI